MGRARTLAATALLGCALGLLPAAQARAGCGCDHPPPAFAPVMPPFASATKLVTVFAEEGEFTPGAVYEVGFGGKKTYVVAQDTAFVRAEMPHGVKPGPAEVHVKGPGYDHEYDEALFTALPNPVKLPGHSGAFHARKLKTAVAEDGTLLVPVDLSKVREPTQFALVFREFALDFGRDDVGLYNADGVDLTLFTLHVADSTERQWGSYYGWEVEDDTGLTGVVYDSKVEKTAHKDRDSDVFTYWRHEFHTYEAAHAPGGTHEVDDQGFHPDGTLHIDHDLLVIAIRGFIRPQDLAEHFAEIDADLEEDLRKAQESYDHELEKPDEDSEKRAEARQKYAEEVAKAERKFQEERQKLVEKAERPKGGDEDLDVALLAIQSPEPVEPEEVVAEIDGALTVEEIAAQ